MLNEINSGSVNLFNSKDIFKILQENLVKTAIENYIKKLTVSFVKESYFLYDKSNMVEQTFITEINKLISVYNSISYFGKKSANESVNRVSFNNSLTFSAVKDTIKNTLSFELTKIDATLPALTNKKIHGFSLMKIGIKRKSKIMNDPIETVIIRGQQKFDLYDVLNPIQIQINNGRILNTLKKNKNVNYKLTPIGILVPSSVKNYTNQIFVTYRALNNTKVPLINRKIYNIHAIINLNKINNWEYITRKSLWVNASFNETDQINNTEHIYFEFTTSSLNDLLYFSLNLIDNSNKPIEFSNDKKNIHFKF